jgi:hypothetical protein
MSLLSMCQYKMRIHHRSSENVPKIVIEEDDLDKLPSRQDLKRLISQGIQDDDLSKEPTATAVHAPIVTTATPVNTLKENLWSEKSRRLYDLVDQSAMTKELNQGYDFRTLHKINCTAPIGLKNTFMASQQLPGTLQRLSSEWMFGSLRFTLKEVCCVLLCCVVLCCALLYCAIMYYGMMCCIVVWCGVV